MAFNLFVEAEQCAQAFVMALFEVILHDVLLLINLVVFAFDGIELFDESLEVLVFLSDLEDFALELGNEQVLSITCLMNGVVGHLKVTDKFLN